MIDNEDQKKKEKKIKDEITLFKAQLVESPPVKVI